MTALAPAARGDALADLLSRAVRDRARPTPMLQRALRNVADSGATPHARWGDGQVNEEQIPAGDRPIIIEVMEFNLGSALAKVDQVAAIVNNAGRATRARIAIAIAFNRRARDEHVSDDSQLTDGWTTADYADLINGVTQIAARMQQHRILGACFPVVWSSTMKGGGYTFPFLEMRARTTLHKATMRLVDLYRDEGEPIVRSMDADVTDDPLLLDRAAGMNALDVVWDVDGGTHVVSGGYDWDTRAKPAPFWGENVAQSAVARWNGKWTQILTLINTHEHQYRKALLQGGASLLYWPEPNVYMTAATRQAGAKAALKAVKPGVQMKESIFYLKKHASEGKLTGTYDRQLRTVKPAKDAYFRRLRQLIIDADAGKPGLADVEAAMEQIWQTHMSASHVGDIQKDTWYGVKQPYQETPRFENARKQRVTALANYVHAIL